MQLSALSKHESSSQHATSPHTRGTQPAMEPYTNPHTDTPCGLTQPQTHQTLPVDLHSARLLIDTAVPTPHHRSPAPTSSDVGHCQRGSPSTKVCSRYHHGTITVPSEYQSCPYRSLSPTESCHYYFSTPHVLATPTPMNPGNRGTAYNRVIDLWKARAAQQQFRAQQNSSAFMLLLPSC